MNAVPKIFDPPLDRGIAAAVSALVAAGIETFESCEGGPGARLSGAYSAVPWRPQRRHEGARCGHPWRVVGH